MRTITFIIVHCSATPEGRSLDFETCRRDHIRHRRFHDIGYHFYVTRDGKIHIGRPLEQPGAHCKHHNRHSIGICYEGGLDAQGHPRELHTDLAVDAIDFSKPQNYNITHKPVIGQAVNLKTCDHFTTNIVQVEGSVTRDYSDLDSFVIYSCLSGKAEMTWGSGEKEMLTQGDTVLVPAQLNEITLQGNVTFLEVWLK